jgi:hypothetical protein
MKRKIMRFIVPGLVTLAYLIPQGVWGTERETTFEKQKKPTVMQLVKGNNDTLEAPIGTGANVLLKISMDLKDFRDTVDQEYLEAPVRLYLTDFASSPTNHPAVNLRVKVDCESKPLKMILPAKPASFASYAQFTNWLDQGYFTNQVGITYDFHIDLQKVAPSLAQHLFFLPPEGYHFIGTHEINNAKIIPDSRVPSVSYVSQRGNVNATTATLSGILYLNKKPYPIEEHQQVFPHQKIKEKILKEVNTNRYHHEWLAHSKVTLKVTYEEVSLDQVKKWPELSVSTYSIVEKRLEKKDKIKHLSCVDGSSGEEVDIIDGKIFSINCSVGRKGDIIKSMVKDSKKKLYLVKYLNLTEIEANLGFEIGKYEKHLKELKGNKDRLQSMEGNTCPYTAYPHLISMGIRSGSYTAYREYTYEEKRPCIEALNLAQKNVEESIAVIKQKMLEYESYTKKQHPRWNEVF